MMASSKDNRNLLTDEERQGLAQKLDKKLDDYIDNLPRSRYKDGWTEENWCEEMEKHPFLMSKAPKEGDELPPLLQAIQQIKFDPNENSTEELAENYKVDGNENFKFKKYKWAIDNYSEGIKQKCSNDLLNAQLYTNRAAAKFHLGNYRSSLKDVQLAVKIKTDHEKAILRGAMCCLKLGLYDEAINWCSQGLNVNPDEKQYDEMKTTAENQKKIQERDKRKQLAKLKKKNIEDGKILEAVHDRGINLCLEKASDDSDINVLESLHPAAAGHKVHFDDDDHKCLVWPVIFVYPEYGQTDFISNFHESSRFVDHLTIMFREKPGWDCDSKYKADQIEIFYEDQVEGLREVDKNSTLLNILSCGRLKIQGATPTFLLLVKDSKFQKTFLECFDN